jgi:acyl carrier protein
MTTPDAVSFDDSSILDVVVDVLRTDLKLGDVSVDRETVLAGGDLGLDSLDLLMIVTGTEKRLGIKIPNDKLGKGTMETIGRFVDFVETQRSTT